MPNRPVNPALYLQKARELSWGWSRGKRLCPECARQTQRPDRDRNFACLRRSCGGARKKRVRSSKRAKSCQTRECEAARSRVRRRAREVCPISWDPARMFEPSVSGRCARTHCAPHAPPTPTSDAVPCAWTLVTGENAARVQVACVQRHCRETARRFAKAVIAKRSTQFVGSNSVFAARSRFGRTLCVSYRVSHSSACARARTAVPRAAAREGVAPSARATVQLQEPFDKACWCGMTPCCRAFGPDSGAAERCELGSRRLGNDAVQQLL